MPSEIENINNNDEDIPIPNYTDVVVTEHMVSDMNLAFNDSDELINFESMFFHVSMIEKNVVKYGKDAFFAFYDFKLALYQFKSKQNRK